MRPCPNCGQGASDGARFCSACGAVLDAEPQARQELRKVVTIVFCDLSGSTSLGEQLDPESVRRMVTRYFDAMRVALEHHGGTVEKFIGDAVMAVFGVPSVHEDDALRAVRAAAEMQTALEELNEQLEQRFGVRLRVRTGVNTGEVIAGDASQGHGFVTGDAVNVAARLEQAAPDGEVLIGRQTHELVRDAVEVEPVPPLDLKGKSEPVPAFRLVAVTGGGPSKLGAPLVGRKDELARLRETFDRAVGRTSCELVTILGSAGLGKSRLAEEFAGSLAGEATVVTGRCLSYGEGLTFWPVREVVEALAGIDGGDSAEQARAAIERMLPADDDTATVAERIAGALGVSDVAASPAETFWAVRKLLEATAARRPLVIVFEDVQWAEETFLDLVEYLAGSIEGGPVLLLVVSRSDLLDARPGFGGDRIEPRPLTAAESRELIAHLAGTGEVSADLADLADRASTAGEGNPLFVEEYVRMLVEQPHTSVPPTIHALLAARIERLEPAERAVIEAACVVGRSFGEGAAFELAGGDRSEFDQTLRALERKDLIQADAARFAGEPTFSFKHILICEVAYQGILKEARAGFHERFADWLERTAGERAGEYEEILGHHLERSYAYLVELGPVDEHGRELAARASARLGSSGRRALARGDLAPAVKLLEVALSLLPEGDPARRDLALKLGIALAETGDLSRADALLHARIQDDRRGHAFVVFNDPGGKRHVVDLDDESPAVVGRLEESDVALAWDTEVSRRHAELHPSETGWSLVDDWSSNGSYLNGVPVRGRRPLRDGDVLRFGDTIVQFRAPNESGRQVVSPQPGQATILGERPSWFESE